MKIFLCVGTAVGLMIAMFWSSAYAASSSIVISQAFAGGGHSDSRLRNDYIELFNRGTSTVNLDGWFLQYASGERSVWERIPLSGSIPAGGYYLIQGAGGDGGTISFSHYDVLHNVNVVPAGGKLALLNADTVLNTICPRAAAGLIDFVGYGETNCSESSSAPALSSRAAIARAGAGCVDTDRNSSDFALLNPPFIRSSVSARNPCGAASTEATKSFAIAEGGGLSLQTTGLSPGITVGSARIQPGQGSTTPTGIAIFALRNENGVVTEASVPTSPLVQEGLIYAAVNGPINTGLAIVNPNNEEVTVSFFLIDASNGTVRQGEPVTIPANSHLARFLTELPYGVPAPQEGTFLFTASAPIGVIALRSFTNERGEVLVTTLPVLNPRISSTEPAYIPHFAVNGGWRTEVILVNPSASQAEGTLDFFDQAGRPATIRIGTASGSSIPYSVVQQGSTRILLSGNEPAVQVGSIRITPGGGFRTPVALVVFSYRLRGVTVSETGVAAVRGRTFRTYVELSGSPGTAGWVGTGFAVANTTANAAEVRLELLRLDGTGTGLSAPVTVPGLGQVAKFLNEVFPTLNAPFQGILRMSTDGSISVVGLRGRYNQRGDFLLTTTPPQDESIPLSSTAAFFPHIVDAGGYTTQFVLLNGSQSPASSGTLRFTTSGGQPLALELK